MNMNFDPSEALQNELWRLQRLAEQHLPEDIRDDYDSIEHALMHDELNDLQHLAGQVVLWTCDMFQHIDEDFEYHESNQEEASE
jgi:hypothetical protein